MPGIHIEWQLNPWHMFIPTWSAKLEETSRVYFLGRNLRVQLIQLLEGINRLSCLCGDYRFTECFFFFLNCVSVGSIPPFFGCLLPEFLTHIFPVQSLHLQIYALKLGRDSCITIDIRSSESYGCLLQGLNCWLKINLMLLSFKAIFKCPGRFLGTIGGDPSVSQVQPVTCS